MSLKSLKHNLIINKSNLRLANVTIKVLKSAKTVDKVALKEAQAIKKQIEGRIKNLESKIETAEKNAEKKK